MKIVTNQPFPNRIQWILENYTGPFVQDGPLGIFDPRRDLEVYVDGVLTPVSTFIFDAVNNRYLLFTSQNINLQGVIQVAHHMPNPPFYESSQSSPPTSPPVLYGFGDYFGVEFGS
jgi:hypothetical protein